jgi:hypothetical protein
MNSRRLIGFLKAQEDIVPAQTSTLEGAECEFWRRTDVAVGSFATKLAGFASQSTSASLQKRPKF